jgi:ferrous iron transport protein A
LLQLDVINGPRHPETLLELPDGQRGVLDRLELPAAEARRLMELGFLPGSVVVAARSAPGSGPRVFRVDGAEIALRRATAARLILRSPSAHPAESPA